MDVKKAHIDWASGVRLSFLTLRVQEIARVIQPWTSADRRAEVTKLFSLHKYAEARTMLLNIESAASDLSPQVRNFVLYNLVCAESRLAEASSHDRQECDEWLTSALGHLDKWLKHGIHGAWEALDRTPENQVQFLRRDDDLYFLVTRETVDVKRFVSKHCSFLFDPPVHPSGSNGLCVPWGTLVDTPTGSIRVEDIRDGTIVSSLDVHTGFGRLATTICEIRTSRKPRCVRINGSFAATPTQPVYELQRGWIPVSDVRYEMMLLDGRGKFQPVVHVENAEECFEIFSFSTVHPSHNYVANGVVCHNEKL